MYSLSFPDMFTINTTKVVSDETATMQNIMLLLGSEKKGLFGDPYYGTVLRKLIYQQNDRLLRDIIIDEIYTSISTFMPQIRLQRKDIELSIGKTSINARIRCTNVLDDETIDYTVRIFGDGE